jgi:hypothetical protein
MEKIVRDGMVAVAVSYGFGAGWSTWNDVDPMDARFNQLFLDGKVAEVVALCEELDLRHPDQHHYAGGAYDVSIEWVPVDTKFIINEYDGAESLMCMEDFKWRIA